MIASRHHETDEITLLVHAVDQMDLARHGTAGRVPAGLDRHRRVGAYRAIGHARNELLDLEELEEKDLDELKETFFELAEKARHDRMQNRRTSPER